MWPKGEHHKEDGVYLKSAAEKYCYDIIKGLGFELQSSHGGSPVPGNGKFYFDWRPTFLQNPATGRNLEIDLFLVGTNGRRLAVEIQGQQHKKLEQIQKDAIKASILNHWGIPLIEFWPSKYKGVEAAKFAFEMRIAAELGDGLPSINA